VRPSPVHRALLRLLPVLPALLAVPAAAENTGFLHGSNYTFRPPGGDADVTLFPVVWDVRSAGENYRRYLEDYGIETDWDPVAELLEEAARSGVNTAMIRSELSVIPTPGLYGSFPSTFEVAANVARSLGLDVIVGGFWTDPYADYHNIAALRFLGGYVRETAGMFPGDVIGVFGFDEPEVKYLENPETAWDWLSMTQRYSELCRYYVDLPFSSFISKFGDYQGSEWTYYTDTTSVLNRFARHLDAVILNSYPVTNNDRRTRNLRLDLDGVTHVGGTDLLPSGDVFYRAFCDRDELFTVTGGAGPSTFDLYAFTCLPGFESLDLEHVDSLVLPFAPDRMASSDFRACDVGDRDSGTHLPNGAVVLWDSLAPAGSEVVVIPDGDGIALARLPRFPGSGSAKALLFAVGDGGAEYPPPDPSGTGGILGRGSTLVAGCYLTDNQHHVIVIFSRGADGFRLETPVPLSVPGFSPTGMLWGRFWGTGIPDPDTRRIEPGGFIAYDRDGGYVTCRRSAVDWRINPVQAPCFEGLFGGSTDPVSVFVSHEDEGTPPYCPGSDWVSAVVTHEGPMLTRSRSEDLSDPLLDVRLTMLEGIRGQILSAGSYRPDKKYGDVLLCHDSDGVTRSWETMTVGEEAGRLTMVDVPMAEAGIVLPGLRVMDTRRDIRAGLLLGRNGICLPSSELYWDEYDRIRYEWYSQSFEVGMDLAVERTHRDNCLFANVQAFGRHAFGLPFYTPSVDTLLFLATEPVVKGCRGLVFYSADLALQSGGVGEDGAALYPPLLQNWGPSRDAEGAEVTSRIHEVVALLTGNQPGGGPDFLAAAVDPAFAPLDGSCAENCVSGPSGWLPAPDDTLLNFLALESLEDGTILVMAANESRLPVPQGGGIGFPGRYGTDYEVTPVAGFGPSPSRGGNAIDGIAAAGPGGDGFLVLDMGGMPPLGVSLLELRPTFEGGGPGGSTFLEVACSGGTASVRFKTVGTQETRLLLYDLCGRLVETLWSGTGFGGVMELELETGERPPGVYFLVLASDEYPLVSRVTLFP